MTASPNDDATVTPPAATDTSVVDPAPRPHATAEEVEAARKDTKLAQVLYHDWEATTYDEKWSISFDERCIDYAKARFAHIARPPKLVIEVKVRGAYMHCAKAMMRSRLWSPDSQVDRALLPSMGEMIKDHAQLDGPVESQADMLKRYADDL